MTDIEAGMIAASWRALDALDVQGNLIGYRAAAKLFGVSPRHFLVMSREAVPGTPAHPLAVFLRPATWTAQPSGLRTGLLWWRHRVALGARVWRQSDRQRGPHGADVDPEALASALAYEPEYVLGALRILDEVEGRSARG